MKSKNTAKLLLENASKEDNIYYISAPQASENFEETYLNVREKEQRFYDDDVIIKLPYTSKAHPYHSEWQMRIPILNKVINHLKVHHSNGLVLEIGCGNGWLSANIANRVKADVIALDINQLELKEGARIFEETPNLHFVCADIFAKPFSDQSIDTIVLAGVTQYFAVFNELIDALLPILKPSGEIHLFDSPFYPSKQAADLAKQRSLAHFTRLGHPEMAQNFHHHTFDVLKAYQYKIMYQPRSIKNRLKGKLGMQPNPFPWVCLKAL